MGFQQGDQRLHVISDGHIGDNQLFVVIVDDGPAGLNGKQQRPGADKRFIIGGISSGNGPLNFRHQLPLAAAHFR